MQILTKLEQLVGKTIERAEMFDNEDGELFFVLREGDAACCSIAILVIERGFEQQDDTLGLGEGPLTDYSIEKQVQMGIMTPAERQERLDKQEAARRRAVEARERDQYRQLKKKFEPEKS